ncbi:MAG: hypothetical protein JW940_22075 [Polyangiaceae bacterium]|nr:hypothetical protein [Polyangiaceae bacterium]
MDHDSVARPSPFGRTRHGRLCAAGLTLIVVLGCGLSPKPEPPDAVFDFDAERIDVIEGDGPEVPLELEGQPGSASPPGATIRLYPLDSDLPRQQAEVASDGSFAFPEVPGDQELRIQLFDDTDRSEPLDFRPNQESTRLVPVPRPLEDCLVLEPPKEIVVDRGSSASVTVRSSCEQPVTIVAPELRHAMAGVELGQGQPWPAVLARGDELEVEVRLAADAELDEEIFFIEATEPTTDRRPITLRRR